MYGHIFQNCYIMVAIHCFAISIWFYRTQHNDATKENGYHGIRAIEALNAITEKNKMQYVRLQLNIPGTEGAFLHKVVPDVDDFTDKP